MSRTKLTVVAVVAIGLGLASTVLGWRPGRPPEGPAGAAQPAEDTGGGPAARLARAALAQAAAIDKLPRFDYQIRTRYAVVDSMRAVADITPDLLRSALTAPVLKKDWFPWSERCFSWDEKRLFWELRPGQADAAYSYRFGTATDAWDRAENKGKTSVNFTRRAGVSAFWDDPDSGTGSFMHLLEFSYLRVTPHRYWWGRTVPRSSHQMVSISPEKVSWRSAGVEQFEGEECAVLDSTYAGDPCQRLWVSRASGRLRGVLSYLSGKEPSELALFDDYREIAKGMWLPFREVRTHSWASDKPRKHSVVRSELVVLEARTGVDLAERYAKLLPREGDAVPDQRFTTAVNLVHSDKRTDDEIRKVADAEYKKQLQGQEEFKRIVKPLDDLVGKPAPTLPKDAWVGGERPELAGKPYLVHFWATWCGPCKADLVPLKALAASGIKVVGMHPPGTPAAEVEKVVRDRELGYPTFVAAGKPDGESHTVGGYAAAVFPYCVLVDAQGKVATHGTLSEVTGRLQVLAQDATKPAAPKRGTQGPPPRFITVFSVDKAKGEVLFDVQVVAQDARDQPTILVFPGGEQRLTLGTKPRHARLLEGFKVSLNKVKWTGVDSKEITAEAAAKRLKPGVTVLLSADGGAVDAAYLLMFREDTLVLIVATDEAPVPYYPHVGGVIPVKEVGDR